jgi:CDP-4-dehydro-6-deoxyglucose reductase/3-phenylpropionate/trans-cinnamate dioxygenase ferredoxin subunit/anthranilate 1,2-dioxygenase ferredoxin subunit
VIQGREILLGKFAGKYYALDERCTHRGGPLSEGTLEGGVITCPWHFGQFDIVTGEVRGPPPQEPLKSYELRVEGADILISIV